MKVVITFSLIINYMKYEECLYRVSYSPRQQEQQHQQQQQLDVASLTLWTGGSELYIVCTWVCCTFSIKP